MRTSISRWYGACWLWCGDSDDNATDDNPHSNNSADLGDEVYDALEIAWLGRGCDNTIEVEVGGVRYRMHEEEH